MRILLLNGPPRCGKDTAGRLILLDARPRGQTAFIDKFARVLKERTHMLYGMLDNDGEPLRHDHFEQRKDTPLPEFLGRTPRECYIAVSERLMKPLHGPDIFGRLLLEDLQDCPEDLAIITDSGFREEALVLVEHFGAENVSLVQIHRDGCSFAGDSRNHIELSFAGVRTVAVWNNGTEAELLEKILATGVLGG